MKNVQCLIFRDDFVVISEVVEVISEIGDPDCKLINPYRVVNGDNPEERIVPWLDFTSQSDIMMRSSDVLTFVEPTPELLAQYLTLVD